MPRITQYLPWSQTCLAFEAVMETGEVPAFELDSDQSDSESKVYWTSYASELIEGRGRHVAQQTHQIEVRSTMSLSLSDPGIKEVEIEGKSYPLIDVDVSHFWSSSDHTTEEALSQGLLITRQAQRAALFKAAISRFTLYMDL